MEGPHLWEPRAVIPEQGLEESMGRYPVLTGLTAL